MNYLSELLTSFTLGLLTPLTAVCVLPLYPGYLSYLAGKLGDTPESDKKKPIVLGLIITFGVILFMLCLGVIFTTFLEVSLTRIIGIISPIAFVILAIISLLLIFDIEIDRIIPALRAPQYKNPWLSAFSFGFFFGAIVVPCNPLFIAALFTKSALVGSFWANIINFLAFGLGIGAPLLAFAFLSLTAGRQITNFLASKKRIINLLSGIVMLAISIYYLVFVFKLFQ